MQQLVAHIFGDYIIQSHWMACEKSRRSLPAFVHSITYALPFIFITISPSAMFVITGTHFVIDRWSLAKYVIWAKNFMSPRRYWRPWSDCRSTGYPSAEPEWLTRWLNIIADNGIHLLINFLSIQHL